MAGKFRKRSRKRSASITSRIMRKIRSKNTKPEQLLAGLLRKSKIYYRRPSIGIYGKPDFVVKRQKVAIFCDGDFWHGNNWRLRGLKSQMQEFSGYAMFWREKISGNIARDKKVNRTLRKQGWCVIRLWESDIIHNPEKCVRKLERHISRQ